MQLTQLTIQGFKSFADKTTISFTHGLTGIVGPNGSGKSNITEAIRWALGEQSAKSLRGEKMGDVIFAGTATRAPLNRAEVSLTFDNGDGYLANQPAQVSITRRLYRDGDSEFLINNQQVRLKDIVGLFIDSGLGKESFSFISQGRVEAIFNSKPEDRRGILEEAAGVLKYKQQKSQAEARLSTTTDNLDRVKDIIGELHRQMGPLAEQASLATDYAQQHAQFQQTHIALLALQIERHSAEQTKLTQEAGLTTRTLAAITAKIAQLEQRVTEMTEADQAAETSLNQTSHDLLEAATRLETLSGQANLSKERQSHAQTTKADLSAQLEDVKANLTDVEQKLAAVTAQREATAAKVAQLTKQRRAIDAGQTQLAAAQASVDQAQADYISLLQAQADAKNAVVTATKDQQVQQNQNQAAVARLQALSQQERQLSDQLTQAKAAAGDYAEQVAGVKQQASALQSEGLAQEKAYSQAEARLQQARALYQRAKSRLETLQELQADYTGFFAGVRAVLKHKQQLPGVIGAVAELITVPSEYQQAIEVALGANLQAVVTTDEPAAKQAITFLKQQRAGRATFLPNAVVKPRQLPLNVAADLRRHAGFVGVGAELITFDSTLSNVMQSLLGSLIVAKHLDAGIQLANQTGHRYRIVTLEGDVLNPGGAMTGGHVKQSGQSPLARAQEVTALDAQVAQMAERLQQENHALMQAAATGNQLQSQLQQLQTKLAGLTAQHEAATKQVTEIDAQLQPLQRQVQAARLALGRTEADDQLELLEQRYADLSAQVTAKESEIAELKASAKNAGEADTKRQQQLTTVQAELASAKTLLQSLEQSQAQWQQRLSESKTQRQKLETQLQAIEQTLAQVTPLSEAELAALKQRVVALEQAQADQQQAKAANRERLSATSAQLSTAYSQQQETQSQSQQQQVSLSRLKTELDHDLATLAEEYQLSYEAARAQTSEKSDEIPALATRLKLLKRGLADLGEVNPHAIAEYAEVKERYDYLSGQEADLNEAKAQLLATMSELDEEVKQRFKQIFDQTNEAFQTIFPQMFGGGHAHLALTDPDDLLHSGFEISAQPPGKKLARLSLLSGGERALTAIGLLFAILKVRPVPFSILDEVEASLDDVNVARFGRFLRQYASDTQFIVITHRQGTMTSADMLYGVTMQESGVSKMVAVTLDQTQETEN